MKKLILIFVISQALLFSLHAQTAPDDKENLKQVNRQVVASYQAGKYDDALKFAQQAVDLSVKIFGDEHVETGTAYANLAAIYQAKKKYKEAVAGFEKTLSIYRRKPGAGEKMTARILSDLAFAQALGGDRKQAEQTYQLALASAENAYGKDSREMLPFLEAFAEFYAFAEKQDESRQLFIRRYSLAAKHFQPGDEQLEKIENDFYCFVALKPVNQKIAIEKNAEFVEAVRRVKPYEKYKILEIGILNGKSIFLPKPNYPASAKAKRASGTIPVRVLIDEKGNVTEAKAICGDADLKSASEQSAKDAKFPPFTIDGQPVKASGIIVYNFLVR
jgi:TonB family protein